MGYILSTRFSPIQNRIAEDIIEHGALTELTTTRIIQELGDRGLTYRRTSMLRDIRRAVITQTPQTYEARDRSTTWFDEVFETFREKKGLTYAQATDLWNKNREESWETLEEEELGAQWEEIYNNLFPPDQR